MDNFDFKKYLAEGKLLKEDKTSVKMMSEEDRATRVDKMMSGEYDDEDYKDSKRYADVRADLDEEIDDEDIVIYDGEEHIIMSRDGNMIYIRPLEDSAILGKRDIIKVPARALAYKSDLDKMYDEYKPKDELDEDMNDPVLMKARAAKMADEKEMARQAALDKKYGSNFMDKLDAEIGLKNELQDLKDERAQLMIDMEQEAEPEGGEIADDYGSRLNDIDSRRELIQKDIDDLRMYESINENKFDEVSMDEYGKPWMELSIAQKQELLSYMNRETEKQFQTDYERRRRETSDYMNEEFKIGDKVTFKSGGDDMEIIDVRDMFASDLKAYRVKNADGEIFEYSEDQLQLTEDEESFDLDVTDSGNPETIGDESIERESASPAFETKLTRIYKSIK
tara:strand:- start:2839 stop:4020 length:1182 start_codon:yes stop_codon:yes gene_type:complete